MSLRTKLEKLENLYASYPVTFTYPTFAEFQTQLLITVSDKGKVNEKWEKQFGNVLNRDKTIGNDARKTKNFKFVASIMYKKNIIYKDRIGTEKLKKGRSMSSTQLRCLKLRRNFSEECLWIKWTL